MPLPNLPDGYQAAVYDQLVRYLPGRWFHLLEDGRSPIEPILQGSAFALAHLRYSYEQALNASIPYTSGGPWLSLHLKSIGLDRGASETDASAVDRYVWEFKPTRNTREGELAALEHYFGITAPYLRLETDRATGRFGQFRLVINDENQPWQELSYKFIGEFIRRYVSNGIIPSIDAKLKCLIFGPLPAWQFSDQFPMSWNVQGPLWERPIFQDPLRLPFARNLITQVSAVEWRQDRDRLLRLFSDGVLDAPGAVFLYLSDQGSCPLLLSDYDLEIETVDIDAIIPDPLYDVDGWHFYDGFARVGDVSAGLIAPFFEAPNYGTVDYYPPIDLPELRLLYDLPLSEQVLEDLLLYYGLDFTRYRVTQFFDTEADLESLFDSGNYQLMKSGPWELRLSTGSEDWGNFPPSGTTFTGTPFATLDPESIWWSDKDGNARSPLPIRDADNNIYLHIEFLLNKSVERTIRELELTLFGDRVEYRRFSLPVDEQINCGFIFRVRGLGQTEEDVLDLGDGSILEIGYGGRLDIGNGAYLDIGDGSTPLDIGFGDLLRI